MSRATHESVRCKGHSSQTGQPCRRWATRGTTVCTSHGAAAPQVKQSAADRLAELVDPAITTLQELLGSRRDDVRLSAAKDILDRTGNKPRDRVELTGKDGAPFGDSLSDDDRATRILAIVERARERADRAVRPAAIDLDPITGPAN